jgi:hypothetical protein
MASWLLRVFVMGLLASNRCFTDLQGQIDTLVGADSPISYGVTMWCVDRYFPSSRILRYALIARHFLLHLSRSRVCYSDRGSYQGALFPLQSSGALDSA